MHRIADIRARLKRLCRPDIDSINEKEHLRGGLLTGDCPSRDQRSGFEERPGCFRTADTDRPYMVDRASSGAEQFATRRRVTQFGDKWSVTQIPGTFH